jgi:hypothetical protein
MNSREDITLDEWLALQVSVDNYDVYICNVCVCVCVPRTMNSREDIILEEWLALQVSVDNYLCVCCSF